MKVVRYSLVLLICAGLGLVIGNIFRRATQMPEIFVSTIEPAGRGVEDSQVSKASQLPSVDQLERDLAVSHGVTRWLTWVNGVEMASLEQFPQLARVAKGDPAALRLLAMRWIDLDPRHLLKFLVEGGDRGTVEILSELLFQEWARRDPEALIQEMDAAKFLGPLRPWRTEAAEYITRHNPELGLPLFERWSLGMIAPSMRGVMKWAAEDPRHAAEFTMQLRSHYPAIAAMKTIGQQWAKIDPAAAMAYAETQPNSLGRTLAHSVLQSWAEQDLPGAALWLAKTDLNHRNQFSAPIVEEWAKTDPAAALLWCEANLTGTQLNEAAAGVLRGTAEKDAQAAARLVLAMTPSSARSAAAVVVARKVLPGGQGTLEPARAESIAWLNNLDPEATRRVLQQAVRYWPDADANSMASFLLTTHVEDIPSSVYLLVGRTLGRTDPEGALNWANRLPEHARLAGGSDAFARWCQSQPESAMNWLSKVPTHDARHSAYLKTALEYFAYEHNTMERVRALPHLDQRLALDLVKSMDLPEDRRDRLLSALRQE